MNIDHIHDALNLLDDDLIEDVEKLRSDKTQIAKTGRRNTWIRWVSVAACVCILAFSVYMTDGFGRMLHKSSGGDMAMEETESVSGTLDNESVQEEESLNEVSDVGDTVTEQDETDGMSGESKKELQTALIEIISWSNDGFTGTITGDDNIKGSGIGTVVTVKFTEDVHAEVSDKSGTQSYETIPDSTDFPVGSVVLVEYERQEIAANLGNNTENNSTNEEVILYVEAITLSDTD